MSVDADDLRGFLAAFQRLNELAASAAPTGALPQLSDALSGFLGASAGSMSTVAREVPHHRYADYDVALELLAGPDAQLLGIGGGDQRQHMSLADMVSSPWARLPTGPVDWANVPTGPDSTRRAIALGLRLFRYRDVPVAVLQRRRNQLTGTGVAVLEVLSPDTELAGELIEEVGRLATEHSVLRGNVITLDLIGFEGEGDGYRFLPRPDLPASDVVLPEGLLERITGHVTGIAAHAEALRRWGQHLKRGVLLYGPPGTGKTHTVRHLLGATTGHTVFVLHGETLSLVGLAAAMARNLQPSIVVLEDCDLVAMDRGFGAGARPLLFEVLDALDGLDSDADVAFLLTTNRVDVLEEALAQRPGRVDLAVEIPLPGERERRRLLELYRGAVPFTDAALDEVAHRSDARTASFFKELMRRAVLIAAEADVTPADPHLHAALASLLDEQEKLSAKLITGFQDPTPYGDDA